MGTASVASNGSASVKSNRSSTSAAERSKSSRRSAASSGSKGIKSTVSNGIKSTLSEQLSHIDEKSASKNESASAKSSSSSAQHSTSSRHSASSKKSSSSNKSSSSKKSSSSNTKKNSSSNAKLDTKLERISEKSALTDVAAVVAAGPPSVSSWREPYESSTTSNSSSVSSWSASVSSKSSRTSNTKSSRTSNTSTTQKLSNKKGGPPSSDGVSVASSRSTTSKFSCRGQQAEGIDELEAGNYHKAVLLLTQAVQSYLRYEGGKEVQVQQAFATSYGYRCEALYGVGAYDAAVRDARYALGSERLSQSSIGDHPYSPSDDGSSSKLLHPERGVVLRAKVLCSLGYSLLRGGRLDDVKDVFKDSIGVSKKALEDAEDLTESERRSCNAHKRSVYELKDTIQKAAEGLSALSKFEQLKTKLDQSGSHKKDYLSVLDSALKIAPAAIELHVAKVKYYVGRRRWFAVANHCEQVASKAAKFDGLLKGDLVDIDPFPGIPPLQELEPDFFAEESKPDKGVIPSHLRVLSMKATRDAVFRMPNELLPFYLRALRLEERYKDAVLVGTALAEFDAQAKKEGAGKEDTFAENKRFHQEWDKLDRTIKVKEEGDALFRDGYYERALTLYGECLVIDGDEDNGGKSILKQASSWAVPCTKAHPSGGKLHAVLHSNRAACFSSMGRYEDAIKETSHAIEIHSMYTRAILRRGRCYAKSGQNDQAKADFKRYIILVDGAREFPYPPPNQGSSCYFDMPADVSNQQLDTVKSEMNELGMKPRKKSISTRKIQSKKSPGKSNKSSSGGILCCKAKNVESQVVETQPSHPSPEDTQGSGARSRGISGPRRRVSFRSNNSEASSEIRVPPPQSFPPDPPIGVKPTLIKSRPAFDHPIDAPNATDMDKDYYAMLDLPPLASDADIKRSYHKLAREYHPDRNSSKEAQARFHDVKLSYAILGDKGKKREYDRANALDP